MAYTVRPLILNFSARAEGVTLDQVIQRVPKNYLRAVFASYLGSRFVYHYGLDTTEVEFLKFIRSFSA